MAAFLGATQWCALWWSQEAGGARARWPHHSILSANACEHPLPYRATHGRVATDWAHDGTECDSVMQAAARWLRGMSSLRVAVARSLRILLGNTSSATGRREFRMATPTPRPGTSQDQPRDKGHDTSGKSQ